MSEQLPPPGDSAEMTGVGRAFPGPPQVEAVALGEDGLLAGFAKGSAYFDLSTNSPTVVRRLYARCKEQGIPLLLVWLPEHAYMDRLFYKQNKVDARWLEGQYEQLARREGFTFLNLRMHPLPVTHFTDFNHHNANGAYESTKLLAKYLQKSHFSGYLIANDTLAEEKAQ